MRLTEMKLTKMRLGETLWKIYCIIDYILFFLMFCLISVLCSALSFPDLIFFTYVPLPPFVLPYVFRAHCEYTIQFHVYLHDFNILRFSLHASHNKTTFPKKILAPYVGNYLLSLVKFTYFRKFHKLNT